MKILHRRTGKVLLETATDSLSGADLRNANLSDANLSGVDLSGSNLSDATLSGADLRNANLSDAYLWDTIGNRREVVTLQTLRYTVNMTKDIIQIGCENYSHYVWYSLPDEEIERLDGCEALSFWRAYKSIIFKLIQNNFGKSYSNN